MQRFAHVALVALVAVAVALPTTAKTQRPPVRSASGADPSTIQVAVDACRNDLGSLNQNVAGSFGSGRREINWDGVPDNLSAPNNLPPDFFNTTSPRGAVFSTQGSGVQVSANAVNPDNAPVRFGNLNPAAPQLFQTFSPQRLFTAVGSNVVDVNFFIPGSTTPALVSGFGAVFTDVDRPGSARMEFFDRKGKSLATFEAPSGPSGGLSFVCAAGFAQKKKSGKGGIARVRLTSGTEAIGPGVTDNAAVDLVAMDDFIYGEPVKILKAKKKNGKGGGRR